VTREEAIEILKKNRPGADPRRCGLELCTAVDVAIAALRVTDAVTETVTDSHQLSGSCKNCTDHTDGCEYCREAENICYHAGEVNALDELLYITGDDLVVDIGCRFYLAASIKFCPMCGRRLEEV
jgi:hypothetical protein